MSIKARQRYINPHTNRIKDNIILQDSEPLPKRIRNWQKFKETFDNQNNYTFEFSGYRILIPLRYAFNHFKNNTYSEFRTNINGTLYPTLHDPLLVVKRRDREEGEIVLTFYKPFYTINNEEKKLLHIMMYHAIQGDDEIYRFKTIYEAHSLAKVDDVIKTNDLNTVYFKYDEVEGSGN